MALGVPQVFFFIGRIPEVGNRFLHRPFDVKPSLTHTFSAQLLLSTSSKKVGLVKLTILHWGSVSGGCDMDGCSKGFDFFPSQETT